MKKRMLPIMCVLCLGIMSCQAMLDKVIPCPVPKQARQYANAGPNDVAGPLGYTTLQKAYEIEAEIEVVHHTEQVSFMRQAEDDSYKYQIARNIIRPPIAQVEAFRDTIIGSPEEPLSLMGLFAGMGLTYHIGVRRKRPGDKDPTEVELEKAKVKEEVLNHKA